MQIFVQIYIQFDNQYPSLNPCLCQLSIDRPKLIHIDCDLTYTIEKIKQLLLQQNIIPTNNYMLYSNGKLMKRHLTLHDYNIQNNTKLIVLASSTTNTIY